MHLRKGWLGLVLVVLVSFTGCAQNDGGDLAIGENQLALEEFGPAYSAADIAEAVDVEVNGDATDFYFPTSGTHPVALMLQGAKTDKSYYAGFARELARYGFVVAVPNHTSVPWLVGLTPIQNQINRMVDFMNDSGDRGSLPCGDRIDPSKMGVLGHSYGGQAVAQAVSNKCGMPTCIGFRYRLPSQVKAGVLYGVNLKNPLFGNYPTLKNVVPVQFLQGSLDGKADASGAYKTWEKVQNPPKAFVELDGANHYGICDEDDPSGADADPNTPTLDQEIGVETNARWAGAFLRAHVLADAEAEQYVYFDGDDLDAVVTVSTAH